MNTKKQTSVHKKALAIVIIGVIILGGIGFGAYALLNRSTPSKNQTSTNYNNPTPEQIQAGTTTKSNTVNTSDGKPNTTGSDQPSTPTPAIDGSKSIVAITIPNSTSNNTGSIHISTSIAVNTSMGTCTLTLMKAGQVTITQTTGVQPLSTYATCKGFNLSGLTSGVWQANIVFENDTLKGTVSTTVTVM